MRSIAILSLAILLFTSFKSVVLKVYVCDSSTSVAYHDTKTCRGLNKCSHEIIYITKTDAIAKGKRACKICY